MKKKSIDKIVDIAHDATDIAKNVIEPASKQFGGILGTFTGFFYNVVLYPLKCLSARFEQKAIAFEKQMQEKYNTIPVENRTDAPVNILGPVLESLKYNIDEEYMKEMFANLLKNSMDSSKQSLVHPKYVQAISSMNEVDAKVFYYLYHKYGVTNICCGTVYIFKKNSNMAYMGALPNWVLVDDIEDYSIFEVSRALIRLSNIGLLDLSFNMTAGESVLPKLYNKKEIQSRFKELTERYGEVVLSGTNCVININDDGEAFGDIVFGEE